MNASHKSVARGYPNRAYAFLSECKGYGVLIDSSDKPKIRDNINVQVAAGVGGCSTGVGGFRIEMRFY